MVDVIDRSSGLIVNPTILFAHTTSVYIHPLHEECHPFHRLGTKWSMECSNLKSRLNVAIKVFGDGVSLQFAVFCLLHVVQSSSQSKNS